MKVRLLAVPLVAWGEGVDVQLTALAVSVLGIPTPVIVKVDGEPTCRLSAVTSVIVTASAASALPSPGAASAPPSTVPVPVPESAS